MHVTCPQCQCLGLIDTAPLLNKARVTCVRCGADFDALMVDGAVEIMLRSDPADSRGIEVATQPPEHVVLLVALETDEVLALPQEAAGSVEVEERTAVLDIVEPAHTEQQTEACAADVQAPSEINEVDEVPTAVDEVTAAVDEVIVAQAEPSVQRADPLADSGAFEMPVSYEPQYSRAELVRPAEQDKYSLGVRLMRVSPMWLLLCGLTFIGLVVVLNALTGSAEQMGGVSAHAARANTTGNHATNQNAAAIVPAPISAAASPVKAPGQREPEPATQPDAKTNAVPGKTQPAAAPQPAPTAQMQTVAKAVSEPAQAQATGRFTLQVGSYNTPVEANERAAKLKAAGCAPQVVAVELPKRGTWYRVQTGRFGDRAEAARYGAQLRARGAAADFIIAEVAAH